MSQTDPGDELLRPWVDALERAFQTEELSSAVKAVYARTPSSMGTPPEFNEQTHRYVYRPDWKAEVIGMAEVNKWRALWKVAPVRPGARRAPKKRAGGSSQRHGTLPRGSAPAVRSRRRTPGCRDVRPQARRLEHEQARAIESSVLGADRRRGPLPDHRHRHLGRTPDSRHGLGVAQLS